MSEAEQDTLPVSVRYILRLCEEDCNQRGNRLFSCCKFIMFDKWHQISRLLNEALTQKTFPTKIK
jgi:hypothetical protein